MLGTKQRVIFEQYQLEIDHIEQDINMWIELVFQETSMTRKLVFDAMTELVCFETGIISVDDEFAFESSWHQELWHQVEFGITFLSNDESKAKRGVGIMFLSWIKTWHMVVLKFERTFTMVLLVLWSFLSHYLK